MGPEVYKKLKSLFVPDCPTTKSFAEIMHALASHYAPKNNVISERYKFYKCEQSRSQSVSDYLINLKALAQSCEFKNFLNDALRDKFVCGIFNSSLRQKLLNETDLTFEQACTIALNYEESEATNKLMDPQSQFRVGQGASSSHNVRPYQGKFQNSNYARGRGRSGYKFHNSRYNNRFQNKRCGQCTVTHSINNCPSRKWSCHNCSRLGHTSKFCRLPPQDTSQSRDNNSQHNKPSRDKTPSKPSVQSRIGNIQYQYPQNWEQQAQELRKSLDDPMPSTSGIKAIHSSDVVNIDETLDESMNSLELSPLSDEEIDGEIKAIGDAETAIVSLFVENEELKMEVDTGACVSMISHDTYEHHFAHIPVENMFNNFISVTGELIDIDGKIKVRVRKIDGDVSHNLELIITKANKMSVPLVGRSWINVLWPEWKNFF